MIFHDDFEYDIHLLSKMSYAIKKSYIWTPFFTVLSDFAIVEQESSIFLGRKKNLEKQNMYFCSPWSIGSNKMTQLLLSIVTKK